MKMWVLAAAVLLAWAWFYRVQARRNPQALPTRDAFRMLRDSRIRKRAVAGTIVYKYDGDYGLAKDVSRKTGIEHITVTLDEHGEGLGFTVPVRDIEYADGSRRTIETPGYAEDGPYEPLPR